jgi:aminoglycoside phosphotransferase (APT) family kinase protein
VVAARENRQGDCSGRYEEFTITLYPFVDGENIEPGRQTEAYASGLASLLAAFHQQGSGLPVQVPIQTFDQPHEAAISHALRTVEAAGSMESPIQERLRELLLGHRSNILTTIETMRQLKAAIQQLELDWVLTHGDPNWENILVGPSGTVSLLDCEDVALGPPEADLVFYSDRPPERFEAFLRQYLAVRPQARLHTEMFAFGHYMWTMQVIAHYTKRILFGGRSPAEDEQAWAELQPCVPAPHAEMAAAIRQIAEILERVYDAGRENRSRQEPAS